VPRPLGPWRARFTVYTKLFSFHPKMLHTKYGTNPFISYRRRRILKNIQYFQYWAPPSRPLGDQTHGLYKFGFPSPKDALDQIRNKSFHFLQKKNDFKEFSIFPLLGPAPQAPGKPDPRFIQNWFPFPQGQVS